tara:strand:- start:1243 stop:1401 length:159 start_codon:yes stop_codon:yes gene_type:complete
MNYSLIQIEINVSADYYVRREEKTKEINGSINYYCTICNTGIIKTKLICFIP